MEEWKKYKLGDVCSRLRSGKGIKADSVFNTGKYPVIGGNGVRGYADESNFEGQAAVIGRQGAYCGNVRFFEGEAYMTEHAVVAVGNEHADTRFLACLLSLMHLGNLSAQSAQPGISVQILSKQLVCLPSIYYQRKVSAIIKSLDDKIELNRKINANLEAQAQALFKSWFVDFEPFKNGEFVESELGMIPKGWRVVDLQDVVTIKRGGSPRPIQAFLSISGYRWLKISDATACQSPYIYEIKEFIKESGLPKTVKLGAGSLVLSNSATPGIPKILGVDSCIHDGWLYFPQSQLSKYYLYMLFKEKRDYLLSQGNGSVFTNLKTDIVKTIKIAIPNEQIMSKFNIVIESLFILIEKKTIESRHLAELRDALLPRLMSGELKVNEVI